MTKKPKRQPPNQHETTDKTENGDRASASDRADDETGPSVELDKDVVAPAAEEQIVEVSLEELRAVQHGPARDLENDKWIDTQHGDGSTYDPHQAEEQGLVYTPPSDPPVVPSDDFQGAEIAAGFAQNLEESDADAVELPERVDNNDLDLKQDVEEMLRYNSETISLSDIEVAVVDGVVTLYGQVETEPDIALAEGVVRAVRDVQDVKNRLQIAGVE